MYLAVVLLRFIIMYSSFSLIVYEENSGLLSITVLWRISLIEAKVGHWSRKCISVSTVSVQKGQKRLSFGILLCRPVSIIKVWFESLSLLNCFLVVVFLISVKYFSGPISFLKGLLG